MEKPKLYTVIFRDKKGNLKSKMTDSENTALSWEVRTNGTTYKDTRYRAKLRLYSYLNRISEPQARN